MKEFKIDGVIIFSALEDFTKGEAGRYLEYVNEHGTFNHDEFKVSEINIVLCDDGKIDVNYTLKTKKKFERIRRITGYLTGDLNTWNDAKRAEEAQRVKHGIQNYSPD